MAKHKGFRQLKNQQPINDLLKPPSFKNPIYKSKQKQSKKLNALKKEYKNLNRKALTQVRQLLKSGIDSPALNKWLEEGGNNFSVSGKNFNQVSAEIAKTKRFLNAKTSTVTGTEKVLKTMAKNIDRPFIDRQHMIDESKNFFELASKTEQYLRMVRDSAGAHGYQKIWESINQYVDNQNLDLSNSDIDVNSMVESVVDLLESNNDIYNIKTDIKRYDDTIFL